MREFKPLKPSVFQFSFAELTAFFEEKGMAKFRAKQLWNWLYVHGQCAFNQMSNLPGSLKVFLENNFSCETPRLAKELTSNDGTKKWLFEGPDGKRFEAVFIPERSRGTLCVSSQIGCFVGCKFCRTGSQGFERNLSADEVLGQVLFAKTLLGDWPTNPQNRKINNLVFMGMGEPLFNYENLCKAVNILTCKSGLEFSRHDITVSTSGITDKILPLARDTGVNLAVSLHAVSEEKRSVLIPINKTYKLSELFATVKKYPEMSKTDRVTFEYVMLEDINDSEDDARLFAQVIKGIRAKINLIPFNAWDGSELKSSCQEAIERFALILRKAGYICTIRNSRGQDIMAACGQLKTSKRFLKLDQLQLDSVEKAVDKSNCGRSI